MENIIHFCEQNGERKLLELLDVANLSKPDLDDLPFGCSTTFSRFFDIAYNINTKMFGIAELGGCFCEEQFIVKFKNELSEIAIDKIKSSVQGLYSDKATVKNLVSVLDNIIYIMGVEEVILDNFASEDRFNRRLSELRRNIERATSRAIAEELEKFQEKYPDSDDVIEKVSREY